MVIRLDGPNPWPPGKKREDFDSLEEYADYMYNDVYTSLLSVRGDSPSALSTASELAAEMCRSIYPPFKPKPFKPKKASNETENAEPCQSPQDTSQ